MADGNEKSSLENMLSSSYQAAKAVQAAVKTGKAVAGAAKGAAAAGPYGAAAVFLWENRKAVGSIIIVLLAVVFLIPVLFMMLLPSVIFDGFSGDIPDVLNNNAVIIQNISEAEEIIRATLNDSYNAVMDEIGREIAGFGENESAVIENETQSMQFNTLLLISQYCAAKDDYTEINLSDLRRLLSTAYGYLYSYVRTEDYTEDDEAGETYITYTYKIKYVGDEYFAYSVFYLSEEKMVLASNYVQNLSLFLYGTNYHGGAGTSQVSEDVLKYEPLIIKYAQAHGIPEFVEVIKAIMMQESGGRLLDPMQSSECPYNKDYPNKPGGITDPEYSIDVGIKYFAYCLSQAGCSSPTDMNRLSLALQGYNFGGGYIGWALSKYGGYTEANASEFSDMKKAQLGWPRYGDKEYVKHVLRYYNPYGGVNENGYGSPFIGRNWREAVTSEYGYRKDPLTGALDAFHDGIDIAYPTGTPINAIAGGTVIRAVYSNTGYGNNITIDHGNGVTSLYAHCSTLLAYEGQIIKQGDIIANVGATGRVTGAHLHLTIKLNGSLQNPRLYIK